MEKPDTWVIRFYPDRRDDSFLLQQLTERLNGRKKGDKSKLIKGILFDFFNAKEAIVKAEGYITTKAPKTRHKKDIIHPPSTVVQEVAASNTTVSEVEKEELISGLESLLENF